MTRKTAKEFSKTIRNDLKRLKDEGIIDDSRLDEISKYNIRQLSISHPTLYLNVRPFYESRNKVKGGISRTMKTLLPKYKQRLHTIDLINELVNTEEDLERKIDRIEEKIAELEKKEKKN